MRPEAYQDTELCTSRQHTCNPTEPIWGEETDDVPQRFGRQTAAKNTLHALDQRFTSCTPTYSGLYITPPFALPKSVLF